MLHISISNDTLPRNTVKKIKQYLVDGNYRYLIHCDKIAEDRIVTDEDIRNIGKTVKFAKLQANGAYKLVGLDKQDLELTVVCKFSIKLNLLIITVY